ncbi:MAG: preprotein translocase subunit SecE [Acaryochloridaceae cyanobacterium CSU_3_4]|nr:preprotein translocase subunit SecE [Acaryochloridaceae cyanobacterium CSU_3_4]
MAKRRKKRNNTTNGQPFPSHDVDAVSDQISSTDPDPESSISESSSEDQPVSTSAAKTGGGSIGFFKGTIEELEKVVWPDRQQLISESIAVILMVSLSAFIISFVDSGFSKLSQLVFR